MLEACSLPVSLPTEKPSQEAEEEIVETSENEEAMVEEEDPDSYISVAYQTRNGEREENPVDTKSTSSTKKPTKNKTTKAKEDKEPTKVKEASESKEGSLKSDSSLNEEATSPSPVTAGEGTDPAFADAYPVVEEIELADRTLYKRVVPQEDGLDEFDIAELIGGNDVVLLRKDGVNYAGEPIKPESLLIMSKDNVTDDFLQYWLDNYITDTNNGYNGIIFIEDPTMGAYGNVETTWVGIKHNIIDPGIYQYPLSAELQKGRVYGNITGTVELLRAN